MERDRTSEEQARLEAFIDRIGPARLFSLMKEEFGLRRMAELIGWLFIWQVQGIDKPSELRKKLQAEGMARTTAFRAAHEMKEFADKVLEIADSEDFELTTSDALEVMRRVAILQK